MAANPRFDDPNLWTVEDGVTVFDEHDEPQDDGTVQRFDKPRLEGIVRNCNVKDQQGQYCKLTLGHTKDDAPEYEQPESVGFARKFRVEWSQELGRWVIRCAYFLNKGKEGVARTYPSTSVERWIRSDFFDPIALLRRTPDRPVGQWTYARKGEVVRYAMGATMSPAAAAPATPVMPSATNGAAPAPKAEKPPYPEGVQPGSPDADFHDKVVRSMKHCYGKELDSLAGGTPNPGLEAPQVKAPVPKFPEPGNDDDKGKDKLAKDDEERKRMAMEGERIKYAALEERQRATEAELAVMRYEKKKAVVERKITQVEAEGYVLNRPVEFETVMKMEDKEQDAYLEGIKQYRHKAPIGNRFFDTGPAPIGGQPRFDQNKLDKALEIHRSTGVTMEEAAKQVMNGQ
jgi:hypothetical protein